MKKDKPKMTSAMQRSWRPGGPSRIAYDKRMQDKKTAPVVNRTAAEEFRELMDHRPSQPAAQVIGQPKAAIACEYYKAACRLLLTDNPDFRKPAEHLIAEADAIFFGVAQ